MSGYRVCACELLFARNCGNYEKTSETHLLDGRMRVDTFNTFNTHFPVHNASILGCKETKKKKNKKYKQLSDSSEK